MLTHVSQKDLPEMVDVGGKEVTHRRAVAEGWVALPAELAELFRDGELKTKKGPVFQTAIIAGTMAVKKTNELIPFCHQVPIDDCKFTLSLEPDHRVHITCSVSALYRTGVEMEALTGVSVAALTVYDMCKAVSQRMTIEGVRLVSKHGGKSDYERT